MRLPTFEEMQQRKNSSSLDPTFLARSVSTPAFDPPQGSIISTLKQLTGGSDRFQKPASYQRSSSVLSNHSFEEDERSMDSVLENSSPKQEKKNNVDPKVRFQLMLSSISSYFKSPRTSSMPQQRDVESKEKSPERRGKPKRNQYSFSQISVLVVLLALGILALVFIGAAIWGTVVSIDPCVKATQVAQSLANNPRPMVEENGELKPWIFPKIVHQQWKTTKIPRGKYQEWNAKWHKLYPEPEYTHMLWTDDNGRELIVKQYPWFLDIYDNYEFNIQRADAVRYFVLHHYGGLYADLDYEPLTNFWEHLPTDRVGLIESPYQYNEFVQNSLMSSPVKDPFWDVVFELLVEHHNMPVLHATGPNLISDALDLTQEFHHTLPCENFQRMPFYQNKKAKSPFISRLHREVLGRLFPMKQCGDFHDPVCNFGRHHNTASYLPDTGVMALMWT